VTGRFRGCVCVSVCVFEQETFTIFHLQEWQTKSVSDSDISRVSHHTRAVERILTGARLSDNTHTHTHTHWANWKHRYHTLLYMRLFIMMTFTNPRAFIHSFSNCLTCYFLCVCVCLFCLCSGRGTRWVCLVS